MRIATIGSGSIVEQFIKDALTIEGVSFEAVYSRDKERGLNFAKPFDIGKVYTNLEDMVKDPDIDFVYIASPNSLHYEQAMLAMEHGKHVIVEKPFAGNEVKANEMVRKAKEKNVFLFEAICNIHMPNFEFIEENLSKLGDIKLVQCNFSQYSSRYDALQSGETPNVFNPKFSGGALADINIYNLHFVVRLFGLPKKINYLANQHENGIDTSGIVTLKYDDFIVECVGAKDSASRNFGQIQGTLGHMLVEGSVSTMDVVNLVTSDSEIEYNMQDQPRLSYEVSRFKEIYDKEDYQACHELLEHSLKVVKVAETARRRIDMFFEF